MMTRFQKSTKMNLDSSVIINLVRMAINQQDKWSDDEILYTVNLFVSMLNDREVKILNF